MEKIFERDWVKGFAKRWNSTPEMILPLGEAKFCSTIGFGYKDDAAPRAIFRIVNGRVAHAAVHDGSEQQFDWDLRAQPEQWEKWRTDPLTIIGLGVAVTQGTLLFKKGDYRRMIRQMHLAKPFMHFFTIL